MIQRLTSLDSVMDFIRDVQQDPVFSDPMLSTKGFQTKGLSQWRTT